MNTSAEKLKTAESLEIKLIFKDARIKKPKFGDLYILLSVDDGLIMAYALRSDCPTLEIEGQFWDIDRTPSLRASFEKFPFYAEIPRKCFKQR